MLLEKHRQADADSPGLDQGEMRKLKRLDKAARRIRTFLEAHQERMGAGGEPVKSNVTDNESGKIKGPHGVIPGYDGLAVYCEPAAPGGMYPKHTGIGTWYRPV